ncbi:MAG: response regulator transcription factor [Bacteroidia bacterium]
MGKRNQVMKILIGDDHLAVRKGLIRIIEEDFDPVSIDAVSSGEELLIRLRTVRYDIAIVDINMPGIGGLEVVRRAKAESILTPLLVITSLPEEQYARRVLKAGASGFLGKEKAAEELASAIRKILAKSL